MAVPRNPFHPDDPLREVWDDAFEWLLRKTEVVDVTGEFIDRPELIRDEDVSNIVDLISQTSTSLGLPPQTASALFFEPPKPEFERFKDVRSDFLSAIEASSETITLRGDENKAWQFFLDQLGDSLPQAFITQLSEKRELAEDWWFESVKVRGEDTAFIDFLMDDLLPLVAETGEIPEFEKVKASQQFLGALGRAGIDFGALTPEQEAVLDQFEGQLQDVLDRGKAAAANQGVPFDEETAIAAHAQQATTSIQLADAEARAKMMATPSGRRAVFDHLARQAGLLVEGVTDEQLAEIEQLFKEGEKQVRISGSTEGYEDVVKGLFAAQPEKPALTPEQQFVRELQGVPGAGVSLPEAAAAGIARLEERVGAGPLTERFAVRQRVRAAENFIGDIQQELDIARVLGEDTVEIEQRLLDAQTELTDAQAQVVTTPEQDVQAALDVEIAFRLREDPRLANAMATGDPELVKAVLGPATAGSLLEEALLSAQTRQFPQGAATPGTITPGVAAAATTEILPVEGVVLGEGPDVVRRTAEQEEEFLADQPEPVIPLTPEVVEPALTPEQIAAQEELEERRRRNAPRTIGRSRVT